MHEDSSVVFQRESRRSHCPTCTNPNVTQNIWMWIWRIQKYNSETISTMGWGDGTWLFYPLCKSMQNSVAMFPGLVQMWQLYDRNRAIPVNIYHFFFFFNGSICLLYCMNYNICVFVETPLFDRFFFFCKYFYGILKILIREKRFDENFQNILSSVRTINYKLKFLWE